jgi:hypothetical protein
MVWFEFALTLQRRGIYVVRAYTVNQTYTYQWQISSNLTGLNGVHRFPGRMHYLLKKKLLMIQKYYRDIPEEFI